MIDLSLALVNYLRADVTLAGMLGEFRGHPAIFATSPIPEPTTTPFIVTQSVTDQTLDKKDGTMREVEQDISIYDNENGSPANVERVSEYVREKLRTRFDVPNWTMSVLHINGPIMNDLDDLKGRVLSARIILERN